MKKRILKLFNEAGFHQPEMERLGIEDKFEKFAELIVEECAEVLSKVPGGSDSTLYYNHSRALKEHFGV